MRRLYRLTASWALCLSWVLLICSAQPQTFLRPLVQTSLQGVTWILDQNYSLPEGDTRRPQCEMQMEFRLLFVQPLGFQAAMQMINNLKEPVYAWQVGFEFASPSNVTISHVTEGIQLPTSQSGALPLRIVNTLTNGILAASGGNTSFAFMASYQDTPHNTASVATASEHALAFKDISINGMQCALQPSSPAGMAAGPPGPAVAPAAAADAAAASDADNLQECTLEMSPASSLSPAGAGSPISPSGAAPAAETDALAASPTCQLAFCCTSPSASPPTYALMYPYPPSTDVIAYPGRLAPAPGNMIPDIAMQLGPSASALPLAIQLSAVLGDNTTLGQVVAESDGPSQDASGSAGGLDPSPTSLPLQLDKLQYRKQPTDTYQPAGRGPEPPSAASPPGALGSGPDPAPSAAARPPAAAAAGPAGGNTMGSLPSPGQAPGPEPATGETAVGAASEFLAATDAAAQAAQTALVASLRGTDEASLVQPITQGGAADTTAPSQAPAPAPIPDGSVDFSELALTESLSQQAASGIADSALANAPLVSAFEGPPAQLLPLATPAPVVEAVSQQATSSPDPTATQQSVNSPGSPTGMAVSASFSQGSPTAGSNDKALAPAAIVAVALAGSVAVSFAFTTIGLFVVRRAKRSSHGVSFEQPSALPTSRPEDSQGAPASAHSQSPSHDRHTPRRSTSLPVDMGGLAGVPEEMPGPAQAQHAQHAAQRPQQLQHAHSSPYTAARQRQLMGAPRPLSDQNWHLQPFAAAGVAAGVSDAAHAPDRAAALSHAWSVPARVSLPLLQTHAADGLADSAASVHAQLQQAHSSPNALTRPLSGGFSMGIPRSPRDSPLGRAQSALPLHQHQQVWTSSPRGLRRMDSSGLFGVYTPHGSPTAGEAGLFQHVAAQHSMLQDTPGHFMLSPAMRNISWPESEQLQGQGMQLAADTPGAWDSPANAHAYQSGNPFAAESDELHANLYIAQPQTSSAFGLDIPTLQDLLGLDPSLVAGGRGSAAAQGGSCRATGSARGSPSAQNSSPDLLERAMSTCVDIDFHDIVLEEKIGSGAFGSVFRGTWRERAVAIKIMQSTLHMVQGEPSSEIDTFRQEVKVLSSLQHPRIICLLGACLVPPHICIVEELAEGGSLYSKLHQKDNQRCNTPMPYPQLLQVALDIASAMTYLHPTVVHRDLKPQNVLLDGEGRAKVCDFGIARFKNRTFISTKNNTAGTPAYMAPEMFEGHRVTEKIDAFSFGILLWECYTGELPWSQLSSPMQVIYVVGVLKQRLQIPTTCPPGLQHLIKHCWQHVPEDRPGFPEILQRLQEEQATFVGGSFANNT